METIVGLALVLVIIVFIGSLGGEKEPTTNAPEPTHQDKQREEMYKGENT